MRPYPWAPSLGVIVIAAALTGGPAQAAVIPGLFNTGVDAAGAVLIGGNGVVDPHYMIVAADNPAIVGQQAVTYIHPAYAANDADSRWISWGDGGGFGAATATYRLTFDLTGLDPATARIDGVFAADNTAVAFLNGVDTGQSAFAWYELQAFHITTGFRTGLNTLDFRVTDQGVPTALRVGHLSGTADIFVPPDPDPGAGAAVPEPAAWALMLTGFFGAGGMLRRRRQGVVLA